jgi:hypothetical protein
MSGLGGKADLICSAGAFPPLTDIVEKVTAKKLWNRNTQRSNQAEWILESTLRAKA